MTRREKGLAVRRETQSDGSKRVTEGDDPVFLVAV